MDSENTTLLAGRFQEMKHYTRFGREDEQLLAEFVEHARPGFAGITQLFYERVREHEGAYGVFESEEQLLGMHDVLIGWLERLVGGPHDLSFARKSADIGRVHVAVGLAPRYVFLAMNLFREQLHDLADETMGEKGPRLRRAIDRILDIELALLDDAYHEEQARRAWRKARAESGRASSAVERRRSAAFDVASCMIVALDDQGRIDAFNRAAERITGFSAEDAAGESMREFLVVEGLGQLDDAWLLLSESPHADQVPLTLGVRSRRGPGRTIEGFLSRDPLEAGAVLTARDVTDDAVSQARLRQAQRLAAVGTLAAGLAHEIRNPLNGAQLHLTYIERALHTADTSDELEEALGVVSAEIARLSSLVDEFLDFARPARLERQPTSLQRLCRHAVELVEREDETRVELSLPQTEIEVDVDPTKIEQVMLNLLRNAVEAASPDAGGHVFVRAYREPRFGVFEVRDDGPGLPEDAPIFDAFFSTKPRGTGMGLAIVHRIVDDHGGSIETQSKPGETVFRVRLPVARAGVTGPSSED